MNSAAKLAALGLGLGLATGGCGSGTVVIAMVSPTISQVSPQVVTAGTPSVTVTVQGQNFQSNASVTVNGSAMPTTVVNATTLSAKISGSPLAQPAVAHLQVKNSDGAASNEVPLTITSASQPSSLTFSTSGLPGAQSGATYTAALSASGGTPGYTWSLTSGALPPGLALSSSGVISGTPTGSGTFTFAVTVSDSSSPAQTQTVTLSVVVAPATSAPSTLKIASAALGTGQVGNAYSASLNATGGTPGYTWSLSSGSLPAGLTLSSSGVISGTPSTSGTSAFSIGVKDSGSPAQSASAQVSITILPPGLSVRSLSLGAGVVGSSYSTTLTATGGTSGYSWALTSGSLPAGLALSSSGTISGIPSSSGAAVFTVTVTDSSLPALTASAQESLTIAASNLAITSTSLGAAKTGDAYSTTLTATGGSPGYTWSVSSGALPPGLSLSNTGVISGTPTATGTVNFNVTATDSGAPMQTASVQESISVGSDALTITSANPGSGTVGIGYNVMLYASGGVPGYTWTVASGSLPAGLTLSGTGVISGTPSASGASTFTIQVADNESPARTASAQESITIDNATQSNPPSGAQIYVYPQAPIAPLGSYQTVTAIVTGVSNTTVTWSSNGGTIVGTNPCIANEPCTIGLYSASTGTYRLTATSNANQQVAATSTITFTASPAPRMDHPRLLVTSDMVASLQAKATSNNPMYQAIKMIATRSYNQDSSIWTFSTWNGSGCTGGSGPSSDQSANYRENDAYWMTEVALFDSSSATRNQYGCAARDIFMTNIGYIVSGKIPVTNGNRWSDGVTQFAFTADLLMGGGFLSASDQAAVRQYFATFARQQVISSIGTQAVIGNYNTPAQFDESSQWSTSSMRAMNNNYTQSRILILTAAALTFNDNSADDPPLANTCNATRYQVCPDGTAGSLHAYWSYVSGGLLYKYWAEMEDPGVVQQAYNAAFNDLPSQPQCQAPWGTAVPCLGTGRGGEADEGVFYGNSLTALRRAMTAIRSAGYDDPLLYGPQMSIGTTSYWDLRYVADLSLLTGLSGSPNEQSRWNFLTHGDSLNYYVYPSNFTTDSSMLAADSMAGRTDRSNSLEWLVLNTAFGMAGGNMGNCISYCGFGREIVNDYASSTAFDLFVALPANDPTTDNPPADPRQSLPTDWYDAGNQHIVTRTGGWTTGANTIFSYYCPNTQIDHEHQFCGGFDVYSNGEYITKGRMEFNDYNDEMSSIWNKNGMALFQYPGQTWCVSNPFCFIWQSANDGGQFWHGYEGGLDTLYHSELPGYVAAAAEDHNAYNGGWGGYGRFNAVTAASRSLVYLRGSNEVVYYDRGETGSNAWDKATYLVTTGAPAINGNTASWLTRSGNQKVYWTALNPSANTPQLDTTYNDADAANDWEIYGRIKADAGNVASARFLSVLQWGSSTFSGYSTSFVASTAGASFEGALVGSSLVMFMHDWPATLTSMTYPASGATTHYISDLAPDTAYTVTGAGAPSSATTDAAGVLTFNAAGTGSITVSASAGS